MLIAATADMHVPTYFDAFVDSLNKLEVKPDLFLLAGDLIERGMVDWYEKLHQVLTEKIKCPMVACFGNNELIPDNRIKISSMFKDVNFLDDEACMLKIGSETVSIIGTIGSLDNPTKWQLANILNIRKVYESRVELVDRLLTRLSSDLRIVLMHYSPTYKTLEGELPVAYGGLGSYRYENVLASRKPTLVIHGHAHKGTKIALVGGVPVFNVAFPLNEGIVLIDTDKLRFGLQKFAQLV